MRLVLGSLALLLSGPLFACGDDDGSAGAPDARATDGAALDSAPAADAARELDAARGPDAGPESGADREDTGPVAADAGSPEDSGPPSSDAGPGPSCAATYVARFVGRANQQGLAAAVDRATGEIVITGRNQGSVDLGGGPFDAMGRHDVFVVKLGAHGEPIWSRHFRDGGDDSEPKGLAIAPDGTVLVTGYVKNAIDFGLGELAPRSPGGREIFVLALEAGGSTRWARRFGLGAGWAIAAGPAGTVVVTGDASGAIDFGATPTMADGQSDVFVLTLAAADGTVVGERIYAGPNLDVAYGLALDGSGAVTIAGQSYGGVDFGAGPQGADATNSGFVVRHDASDALVYSLVSPTVGEGHALAALEDGSVVMQRAGSVARFGPTGEVLWDRPLPGAPLARTIAPDGEGGIWVTGGERAPATACAGFPADGYAVATRLSIEDGAMLDARGVRIDGPAEVAAWSVGVGPGSVVIAGWLAGGPVDFGLGTVAMGDNDVFAVGYAR